jgi:hypothetical protein
VKLKQATTRPLDQATAHFETKSLRKNEFGRKKTPVKTMNLKLIRQAGIQSVFLRVVHKNPRQTGTIRMFTIG